MIIFSFEWSHQIYLLCPHLVPKGDYSMFSRRKKRKAKADEKQLLLAVESEAREASGEREEEVESDASRLFREAAALRAIPAMVEEVLCFLINFKLDFFPKHFPTPFLSFFV